jgi:NAD(P)-dependent dehydrogenase (short-subunit alcohol dehydrogenase family)
MTVTYDLTNKVAVVTGATGGMGRAITVALATCGANVMASDRNDELADDLLAQTGALAGQVRFMAADVSSGDEVAAMVDATVSRFGGLHYGVNAAAIEFELVGLAESTDDDFDRMMSINLRGIYLCMKHELIAMLATGQGGSIVNIASTNSFRPQSHQPLYTASKHAVVGLTKNTAIDYARSNIRVNAICPGVIDTPMLRNAMERRGRDADEVAARLSQFRRFGTPEEIAQAALWLCSDASSFTTGHALAVDGGMLAS